MDKKKPKEKVSALTKARSLIKKTENAHTPTTIKRKLKSVKKKPATRQRT